MLCPRWALTARVNSLSAMHKVRFGTHNRKQASRGTRLVQVVCRVLGGADAVVAVKHADIRHRLRARHITIAMDIRRRLFPHTVTALLLLLLLLTPRVCLTQ